VLVLLPMQALFRALKTKHETPKYGLIYHASLIGQAAPKFKGKISRVLAAKSALSIRMDALGEGTEATIGFESRAKVEARLRQLEGRALGKISGSAKGKSKIDSYDKDRKAETPGLVSAAKTYNTSADVTTNATPSKTPERKKKRESSPLIEEIEAAVPAVTPEPSKKKSKKEKSMATPTPTAVEVEEEATEEKKKKKKKSKDTAATPEPATIAVAVAVTPEATKSSKKKRKAEIEAVAEAAIEVLEATPTEKKKKKKSKVESS